jgi:hypothetical protein
MKTIKIHIDKKKRIKDMFSRTMVQQKPKVESNKKLYNRKDKSYKEYYSE